MIDTKELRRKVELARLWDSPYVPISPDRLEELCERLEEAEDALNAAEFDQDMDEYGVVLSSQYEVPVAAYEKWKSLRDKLQPA